MTPLNQKTKTLVEKLYSSPLQEDIARLLENECGQNLPFCENSTPEKFQRLRFAALKISDGDMAKLKEAVNLAKMDWRDLLMWAGFGSDLDAHEKWADKILGN